MKSKLEIINLIIAVIIGYLESCMSCDKLLFFDEILKPEAFDNVKKYSLWILLVLGLAYIIVFIIIQIRGNKKEETKTYSDLCRYLFNKFNSQCDQLDQSAYRVTIFKAKKVNSESPVLVSVGRYTKRFPIVNTKLKFTINEGCVGKCFATQQIVSKQISEFDEENPEQWFSDCEKELSISRKKAKKTHMKACTFCCLPLISLDKRQTWGVVVIDSVQKTNEFEVNSRLFEDVLENYAFLFNED